MARKVKVHCAYCGKEVIRDEAFVLKRGKKNIYYCSKEHSTMKKPKELFLDKLLMLLQSTNTIIYKEVNEMAKVHGYDKMLAYLIDNEDYLTGFVDTKNFANDYNKCKYILAVIRNSLGDYTLKQAATEVKKEVVVEIYEPKKTPRKQERKGLDGLLNELLD